MQGPTKKASIRPATYYKTTQVKKEDTTFTKRAPTENEPMQMKMYILPPTTGPRKSRNRMPDL